jgi:hypothetical protein
MKRFLILILLVISTSAYGQVAVSGKIIDKGETKPLLNASVVLLHMPDSILKSYVRTDESGGFKLERVDKGQYMLLVTYPKFELYSQKFEVAENAVKLPDIHINSQANLLEEVVITQKLPIRIKGDTIEYNASSFETEKNAKLEDLLRRLPGLSVSADGAITAHGKSVAKVLIEGEEFFGYDPKIAIRNVRADAVDKVQVYDRRSEEAQLTGIDDGVRIKTVNVVLKEEARKGVFGNAQASMGTNQLFDAGLFAAKFNKSERLGVTANWNNMGTGGGGNHIRMNNQISGSPEYKSIGANYENNLLNSKLRVNSNYNLNNNSNANESESNSTKIFSSKDGQSADYTQETASSSKSESDNTNHSFRSEFKYKLDSLQNLTLQLNAGKSSGHNANSSESSTLKNSTSLINDYTENSNSSSDNQNMDARIDYRRRLNNKGRSLNIQFNNQFGNRESLSQINSRTNTYVNDTLSSTIARDQRNENENGDNRFGGQINISDRFFEKINVTVGYNFNNSTTKDRVTARNPSVSDPSRPDDYSIIDSAYSKDERNSITNHGANINVGFSNEKLNVNVSTRIINSEQRIRDLFRQIDLNRNFWNNNTNMNFNYRLSNSKNLSANYQNSATIPSIAQLQAYQPRTNDLYEQKGNPNLKRASNNNLNFNYNSFSLLKATSINANISIGMTSDPIVNNSVVDEVGKTTSTFVNVEDKTNLNLQGYASITRPLLNNLVQFGPYVNLGYNNNYNYLNGVFNESKSFNGFAGVNANKQTSTIVDFNLSTGVGFRDERTLLNQNLNSTSINFNANTDLKYYLPYKISLSQVINYSYTGKTKLYPKALQQFYMNLEVSKKLLKSESLLLSVKAFDIFNTFNNTNRSFGESNFSESRNQVLTQYLMVGLNWDFNKNLGKKND